MEAINYNALCTGLAIVIVLLFIIASLGMSGGLHYTGRRPSNNPPGWKNIKRK